MVPVFVLICHFFQEREEEEKERREERAKIEKIRREEKRAADKAKREAEFRHLTAEDAVDTSISSTPDNINVSLSSSTPSSSVQTPQQGVTSSSNTKVKPKTTQAAADTSSDVDKKHKDKFVKEMSKVVVKILDPYRKKGVKGHIGNTDDFKHLAKKVYNSIFSYEIIQQFCRKFTQNLLFMVLQFLNSWSPKHFG